MPSHRHRIFVGVALVALSAPTALRADHLTPAERRIASAKLIVQRRPSDPDGYNRLAMALAERARETADPSFYDEAREILRKSFSLSPANYPGMKVKVWVLLGQHRFAEALEHAKELNRQVPDDLVVYALLTDAHVELGNYPEAEQACQWILNMRPGNVSGLTRGAYLRELWGDIDGALELMERALGKTPLHETENRAWIETHIAQLYLASGRLPEADHHLNEALATFSDYHYALAAQASLRTAQGQYADAARLLEKHYQAAPHPENLYRLARGLARAGRIGEAESAFQRFEQEALSESENLDNANRELIEYYVEEAQRPAEALRLARQEVRRRKDIYTMDALAWALAANGELAEARAVIDQALSLGTRDAKIYYHGGVIVGKLGDVDAARRLFEKAIQINSPSPYGSKSRIAVEGLADA